MVRHLLATGLLLACLPVADLTAQGPRIDSPAWQRVRVVYFNWSNDPLSGEICVGYEALPWDETSQQAVDDARPGDRVALARAGWSTLDSFNEIEVGDLKIKGDEYYVALERTKDSWALLLLDAKKVRATQCDPAAAAKAPVLARVPLQHSALDAKDKLSCALQAGDKGNPLTMTITWGTHAWSCTAKLRGVDGSKPGSMPMPRACSRVLFAAPKDGRQLAALLDHGTPPWTEERSQQEAGIHHNGRWRFGEDWWTTLDTDVALQVAGKKLAAGSWHLVLQQGEGDGWNLCCCAAEDQIGRRLDAYAADQAKPTLVVPLLVGKAPKKATALQVQFVLAGKQLLLEALFGDYRLTVPVAMGGAQG